MASPGYSGTPLARKLGITAGTSVATIGAPREYRAWLAPLPDGVTFGTRVTKTTSVVHVFTTKRDQLAIAVAAARTAMKPDAAIWVSWPKKVAKVATDVTEQTIRDIALPLGLVDVKVCAVTDVWSGLKLVIRKELRGS